MLGPPISRNGSKSLLGRRNSSGASQETSDKISSTYFRLHITLSTDHKQRRFIHVVMQGADCPDSPLHVDYPFQSNLIICHRQVIDNKKALVSSDFASPRNRFGRRRSVCRRLSFTLTQRKNAQPAVVAPDGGPDQPRASLRVAPRDDRSIKMHLSLRSELESSRQPLSTPQL